LGPKVSTQRIDPAGRDPEKDFAIETMRDRLASVRLLAQYCANLWKNQRWRRRGSNPACTFAGLRCLAQV
jgi:hypothetical protein